jgi:Formate/nitrite transporter
MASNLCGRSCGENISVIMGFDHVIANQFLIPIGMMFGADISIKHLLFHALLPATLGNIVGGGVFIGAVYWYVLDSMGKSVYLLSRIGWYPKSGRSHDDIDVDVTRPSTILDESEIGKND